MFEIPEVDACLYVFVIDSSGGTIHMVCRSKGRAEAAKDEIVQQSKNEVRNLLFVRMM